MTRRQYRSGSVHAHHSPDCPRPLNAKGKPTCKCPWRGTVEHGYTRSGGRRRITVTGKTEAEAKRKIEAKRRDLARGQETASRTTVKAWAETWLDMIARTDRPKSYGTDRGAVRKWIVPTVGHKRLDQLTPADVRAVTAQLTNSSTALRYHGTLHRMLKAALEEGYPIPPRVLNVRPPTPAVNDRTAIPVPQSLAILKEAAALPHGSRWVAAFLLGVRQGEALGMEWDRIDFDAMTVSVSWQLQPLAYLKTRDKSRGFLIPDGYEVRQLKGRWHLVRPKSKAGWRVYPLIPELAALLRQWREVAPPSPLGLVWPAPSGSPRDVVDDREEFKALQVAAGVEHPLGRPYTVHEARHSVATLLRALKVPESVIVQIMGHSTVASTTAYLHTDTELAREAFGKVAETLQLTPKETP